MYTLLCQARLRKTLSVEAPSLAVSLLLAEAFYKFHSFALECVAFLATWFLLSGLLTFLGTFRSRE